jgi:hypothetical protein
LTALEDSLFAGTARQRTIPEYIDKPEALDLFGGTYLCVDVRILVALFLCSVKDRKSLDWREGASSYDDTCALSIRPAGPRKDVLVAHFHGRIAEANLQYTKAELTALMNGYPPWYREQVICAHGPALRFPIQGSTDNSRGGWVVAVGLTDTKARKPLALYVVPNLPDRQTDGSYYLRSNGAHLRRAVHRVYDVLLNIEERITNESSLKAVISAVSYMMNTSTGSGVEKHLPSRTVPGGSMSQLSAGQCKFTMELFNKLVPTDADIQELRPILAPVLQAAFNGSYEVIQYLKDTGMRLVMPEGLGQDLSRKIYLRDCFVDDM